MTNALAEIVRSAALPGLHAEQALDEVLSLLGPPADTSVGRSPLVIRYGSLELAFRRDPAGQHRLIFAGIYFRDPAARLPQPIRDAAVWPSEPLTEGELLRLFASIGSDAVVEARSEDSLVIVAGKVARFVLGREDEGGPFVLDSIQLLFG